MLRKDRFCHRIIAIPDKLPKLRGHEDILVGKGHPACLFHLVVVNIKVVLRQDKVNYAVSEREDRVTDLTTLRRMTGCTGMYWALLEYLT